MATPVEELVLRLKDPEARVRASAARALGEIGPGAAAAVPELTEALSAYLTRLHGREIPVARSTITPGGMQAVFLALELVVDQGSNVVYVEPQWPNIRNAIHASASSGVRNKL